MARTYPPGCFEKLDALVGRLVDQRQRFFPEAVDQQTCEKGNAGEAQKTEQITRHTLISAKEVARRAVKVLHEVHEGFGLEAQFLIRFDDPFE